ncbi:hypothetical protein [Geothermobacter hydrogeniphilus]|uniref:VWA domain-containing protein n=1 Tax=Geothermobacter hydrogeniphilus TaxID=1969733 RepID=A0A1X0YCG4_9BACT|nr:hypothetical protein [Geothermobacter hydrogeniphilus]ORJ62868.1 hypothetical protein B5V00_02085 [Geothermobacter hydrogeniphilus]
MRKHRRQLEIFNLSFLDVISCGFGAIILLLVIARIFEPQVIEQTSTELSGQVIALKNQLEEIRGETRILNRELTARQEQLSDMKNKLARLQGELNDIEGRYRRAGTDSEAQSLVAGKLESARQKLDEEMQRLTAGYRRPAENAVIGGIPVDSEYIIFIIDTSGSMQQFAWPLVRRKMKEVLDIYPHVKGIQVLNDMGDYMFSQYAGRWIPDSKARRRAILNRLAGWAPFSNSSPVEGVVRAIQRFYAPDRRISLYVFGDDFAAGDMQAVIEEVRRRNAVAGRGSRVRIHTVGFPVQLIEPRAGRGAARFAALMRRLAEENNGSFVGLGRLR